MTKHKKPNDEPINHDEALSEEATTDNGKRETTAGYFRRIFQENPRWLKEKSNQKLLDRWLLDNPGHTEVPKSIRGNLANLKSTMRSKKRKRISQENAATTELNSSELKPRVKTRTSANLLETLEHQIDECLSLARGHDRDKLGNVIHLLRRARNAVVWKMSQD